MKQCLPHVHHVDNYHCCFHSILGIIPNGNLMISYKFGFFES